MCQCLRPTRIFRGSRGSSFLRENGCLFFLPIIFCRRRSEYREVVRRLSSVLAPKDLWVKCRLRFRISFAGFLLSLFVFPEYHSESGDTIIALVITVIVILRQSKKDTLRCFGAEFEGIRILAARRCSVRLGSDSHPRLSFTTEPVRIPLAKAKRTPMVSFLLWRAQGDSNPRPTGS